MTNDLERRRELLLCLKKGDMNSYYFYGQSIYGIDSKYVNDLIEAMEILVERDEESQKLADYTNRSVPCDYATWRLADAFIKTSKEKLEEKKQREIFNSAFVRSGFLQIDKTEMPAGKVTTSNDDYPPHPFSADIRLDSWDKVISYYSKKFNDEENKKQ